MTNFYICRHGQTENNKNQRLSGWIDTPLTGEGVENAKASAEKLRGLKIDKIVSSDLGRAFVTSYLIARELGITTEIERTASLREVNYGELANLSYARATAEAYPLNTVDYIPPGGESLGQMQQRVLEGVETISSANPDKTVLLVAHHGTVNAIYAAFAKLDIGYVDGNNPTPHDFVGNFKFQDGSITDYQKL